jgi:hypothetical protein
MSENDVTVLTARQRTMIAFALRLFMDEAHNRALAAGQDKEGKYFKPGAVTAFLRDAGDAEDLLRLMRGGSVLIPPPSV